MDINALRAFALVGKLGNLTKAAALLFTSQPAISVQIKALEEELGATLFIFHHEVKTTGFSRLALASLFFKLSFMR